jgi:hypothetical protein
MSITDVGLVHTGSSVTHAEVLWANCTVSLVLSEETIWQTITDVLSWDTVRAEWTLVLAVFTCVVTVLFIRVIETVGDGVTD